MKKSDLETKFAADVAAMNLPEPKREFRFHSVRQWRIDFAWPEQRLIVEIEGGTWNGGRHVTGRGFEEDCEKYNAAVEEHWRVLRYTTGMVKSGLAAKQVARILRGSI